MMMMMMTLTHEIHENKNNTNISRTTSISRTKKIQLFKKVQFLKKVQLFSPGNFYSFEAVDLRQQSHSFK